MGTTLREKAYGDKAFQLMEQLGDTAWYENAGEENDQTESQLKQFLENLQVDEYEIKWASKDKAAELISEFTFQNSALWEKLKDVPEQLKEKITETAQQKQMEELIDRVPELVYVKTFDRAYEAFGEEKLIQYLVVHGMYISTLACVAELANDDLFTPIVEMVKDGHIPLSIQGNTIYLL